MIVTNQSRNSVSLNAKRTITENNTIYFRVIFHKKNNDFDFYNIFYETSFLDLAGTQLQNVMFYSIYATTRLAKLKFARIRFHLLSAHGSIPLF